MILCSKEEAVSARAVGLAIEMSFDSGNTWSNVEDLDLLQSSSRFTAYRRTVSNNPDVERELAERTLQQSTEGIHPEKDIIHSIYLDCHQDLAASRQALSYPGEDYYSDIPILRRAAISKSEEHLADLVMTVLAAAEELGWKVTEAIQLKSAHIQGKEEG